MSKAAELFEAEIGAKHPAFDEWLLTLPEDDRKLFLTHADNPRLSHLGMYRIAKELGAVIGKDAVTAWRKANGFPRR